MSGADAVRAANVKSGLLMNRMLYEGRGNDFMDVVRNLVDTGEIDISEEAVLGLLETVRSRNFPPQAPAGDLLTID